MSSEPFPNQQHTTPETVERLADSGAVPRANPNRLPGAWKRVRDSERLLIPTA
ncbi:MAG: hypothetical protein U0936_02870 [Planctomycetaceae bacterium]